MNKHNQNNPYTLDSQSYMRHIANQREIRSDYLQKIIKDNNKDIDDIDIIDEIDSIDDNNVNDNDNNVNDNDDNNDDNDNDNNNNNGTNDNNCVNNIGNNANAGGSNALEGKTNSNDNVNRGKNHQMSARLIGEARGLRVIKGGKNINSISQPTPQAKSTNYANNQMPQAKYGNMGLVKESLWEMEPGKLNWYPINDESMAAMRRVSRRANQVNIAVVDENPSVLLKVKNTLTPYGYEVRTFSNPSIALLKLKDEPCDLLIATCKLKYMNGIKVADFAKTTGLASHILLLLEKGDGDMLYMIRNEHINGYLLKPLSHNELIDKVSALFD